MTPFSNCKSFNSQGLLESVTMLGELKNTYLLD